MIRFHRKGKSPHVMAREGPCPLTLKLIHPEALNPQLQRGIELSYQATSLSEFKFFNRFYFFFITIARLTELLRSLRLVIEADSAKHHLHSTSALTFLSRWNRFIWWCLYWQPGKKKNVTWTLPGLAIIVRSCTWHTQFFSNRPVCSFYPFSPWKRAK